MCRIASKPALFLALSLSIAACGGDHHAPLAGDDGTYGKGGAGGRKSGSRDTGGGGAALDAGPDGTAAGRGGEGTSRSDAGATSPVDGSMPPAREGGASGGAGEAGFCGNGVLDRDEFCDGDDLRGATCATFGFSSGELRCNAACNYDRSACVGVETCFDAADDDGDGKTDCADSDCKTACATTCDNLQPVAVGELVSGNTTGHAAELTPSCLSAGASGGPEVVYRVVPAMDGVIRATVTSEGADFVLSARSTCASDASELACNNSGAGVDAVEAVSLLVSAGKDVLLVVDGAAASEAGAFALSVREHPLVCGDGIRDPGEVCDDGNQVSQDGCSSKCALEPSEHEPNDSVGKANDYAASPFVAQIAPVGDVDVFAVTLGEGNSRLLVDTHDLGDGTCESRELDDSIEILSPDGTVIASDDDGGVGACASTQAKDLSPGTYYVRVTASGRSTTFPYLLAVSSQP
jgi:cysteine-rich repeat protein